MSEGSGFVAFDEEMTCPGEAIADGNPKQGPHVMTARHRPDKQSESQNGPAGMEQSVSWS